MKITYDKKANAAYIFFQKNGKIGKGKVIRTVPVSNDIIVDVGARNNILGVEILNAAAYITERDLRKIRVEAA